MSLDTILELCEKYLNEGEYLQAAQTLKVVHEKEIEANETVEFEMTMFGFKQRTNEDSYTKIPLVIKSFTMEDNDQEIKFLNFKVGIAIIPVRPGYALRRFLKSWILTMNFTRIGWEFFGYGTNDTLLDYVTYLKDNELMTTKYNYRDYVSARVDDFITCIFTKISIEHNIMGWDEDEE